MQVEDQILTFPLKTDLTALKEDYQEKITQINKTLNEIQAQMDVYKNNTMSNIEESIKLAVSHVTHSVISVSSPKQVDPDDIFDKIEQKVDKAQFEGVVNQKATNDSLTSL